MATSSASIEERSITPQAAATFLRPQAGKTSNGIAERSAPGDDVTWTPQPLGFPRMAVRQIHFLLGCVAPPRLGFRRRRGRFGYSRTPFRGSAPPPPCAP